MMYLVYPPKFCITIVFDISWDDSDTLEKLETMVMQNFRGQTSYIIIYVKMVIIKAEKNKLNTTQ